LNSRLPLDHVSGHDVERGIIRSLSYQRMCQDTAIFMPWRFSTGRWGRRDAPFDRIYDFLPSAAPAAETPFVAVMSKAAPTSAPWGP
jgi:hypothetical protein